MRDSYVQLDALTNEKTSLAVLLLYTVKRPAKAAIKMYILAANISQKVSSDKQCAF